MVDDLQYVGSRRLVHLQKRDARRVARILSSHDVTVRLGGARGILYVELQTPRELPLRVRMDDWRKIVPFIRYSSKVLPPISLPALGPTPPANIPSPQRNETIPPAPVNPGPEITSYLAGFDYPTYRQIVNLLPLAQRAGPQIEWLTLVLEQLFPSDFPTQP